MAPRRASDEQPPKALDPIAESRDQQLLERERVRLALYRFRVLQELARTRGRVLARMHEPAAVHEQDGTFVMRPATWRVRYNSDARGRNREGLTYTIFYLLRAGALTITPYEHDGEHEVMVTELGSRLLELDPKVARGRESIIKVLREDRPQDWWSCPPGVC